MPLSLSTSLAGDPAVREVDSSQFWFDMMVLAAIGPTIAQGHSHRVHQVFARPSSRRRLNATMLLGSVHLNDLAHRRGEICRAEKERDTAAHVARLFSQMRKVIRSDCPLAHVRHSH
jgi:hypothetical protein